MRAPLSGPDLSVRPRVSRPAPCCRRDQRQYPEPEAGGAGTQQNSTFKRGVLKDVISQAAPERKGAGKFSVAHYGLPPASR